MKLCLKLSIKEVTSTLQCMKQNGTFVMEDVIEAQHDGQQSVTA